MKNVKSYKTEYHVACVGDMLALMLNDINACRHAHKKIEINPTYVNSAIGHLRDIIDSGACQSKDRSQYPALYGRD